MMPADLRAHLALIAIFASISLSCGGGTDTTATNSANAAANSSNLNSNRTLASGTPRTAPNGVPPYSDPIGPDRPTIQSGNVSNPYPQSGNSGNPIVGSTDLVMVNLHATLRTWSSGDEYPNSASLRSVWVGSGRAEKTFYPQGAEQLISAVQRNSYFSQCGRYSGALRTSMFAPGGPIQTVDHLYRRLYRCDPSN
jgi:hypothetical protein